MTSQARCDALTSRWSAGRRPGRGRVPARRRRPGARVGQRGGEARIGMPPSTWPSSQMADEYLRHVAARSRAPSRSRRTCGLVVVDPARQPVTDAHLQRGRDRRDGERDDEARAGGSGRGGRQHPDRVDRGDHESADQVGRDHHVRGHYGIAIVEDHPTGRRRPPAGRVEGDALRGSSSRRWPPRPRCCRRCPRRRRDAGPEVRPRARPPPPVDVDRDEERLGEEEDPSKANGTPKAAPHWPMNWPQQPELEGEDGPRHRPDRERHRHVLRPALGEQHRVGVALLMPR